jgi:hypothetical protein
MYFKLLFLLTILSITKLIFSQTNTPSKVDLVCTGIIMFYFFNLIVLGINVMADKL